MRSFFLKLSAAAFLFAVGCRSPGPHVPLPSVTPFDDDSGCRTAYLRAYRMGYEDGLKGESSKVLWMEEGRVGRAMDAGYADGNKVSFGIR